MDFQDRKRLPRGCEIIELPTVRDSRGSLSFGEAGRHVPFEVRRVFWTYDVRPGRTRGDHAHRTCSMALFPLGGAFRITLDDGRGRAGLLMDDPSRGVLVPPGVWCSLGDFTPGAACVTLASEPYDPADYVLDYGEFLKTARR